MLIYLLLFIYDVHLICQLYRNFPFHFPKIQLCCIGILEYSIYNESRKTKNSFSFFHSFYHEGQLTSIGPSMIIPIWNSISVLDYIMSLPCRAVSFIDYGNYTLVCHYYSILELSAFEEPLHNYDLYMPLSIFN